MRPETPTRIVSPAARALLAALALLLASPAIARSLVIERFDVEVVVRPDGRLDVTETIVPRFTGSWNGIYRTIPVEYRTPQGFNYSLLLDSIRATDEGGTALRVESSRERHYRKLKIYVPGAADASRTVVLRYAVLDGLRFFEDHDELYWNVTGDEWEVPIESASADVLLPAGVTGVRALAFTGAMGSRGHDADARAAENRVEVRTHGALSFHEGLTVVVGWDKGFVREPAAGERAGLFLRSNWPLAIPALVAGAMFWLWYARGRDPRRRPIAAQYEPPERLTPAEVGTLLDGSADMRDITATIVDLAVRGYLVIEQTEEKHLMGLWSATGYAFHLKKPPAEWNDLAPHERELLDGIFDGGATTTVRLEELQNRFYRKLPGIRDRIFDSLLSRGFYRSRPDKIRKGWLAAGVIGGAVLAWGGAALGAKTGMAPLPFVVAGILSGAAICAFGWFMPARTVAGARALEGVLGFEDFLGHVEGDRYRRMVKTPEMFEKFLPFAMALGVERTWARAFDEIYRSQPAWYAGPGYGPRFYPSMFVGDMNRMAARTGTVFASAPRSSGGSGFGGGGFSGGGFGGGGGGGF